MMIMSLSILVNNLHILVKVSSKKGQWGSTICKKAPQHQLDMLTKKSQAWHQHVKRVPHIKLNVPVYSTEQENEIMDHIIKSLPTDNNRYYTEHKEGSNTFKMKKHPKQDRLYGLISNTEKKYLG